MPARGRQVDSRPAEHSNSLELGKATWDCPIFVRRKWDCPLRIALETIMSGHSKARDDKRKKRVRKKRNAETAAVHDRRVHGCAHRCFYRSMAQQPADSRPENAAFSGGTPGPAVRRGRSAGHAPGGAMPARVRATRQSSLGRRRRVRKSQQPQRAELTGRIEQLRPGSRRGWPWRCGH